VLVEPLKVGRGGAQEGRCTEVYFAPAADLLVAAYGGVRTAGAIKRASGPESSGAVVSPGEDLLLSLSLGLVEAASSVYGFSKVSECRSFRTAQNDRGRSRSERQSEEAEEEAAVRARVQARQNRADGGPPGADTADGGAAPQ